MADPTPGAVPVTDQRPIPRGGLPRHAQTWVMVAVAVVMLVVLIPIMVFNVRRFRTKAVT